MADEEDIGIDDAEQDDDAQNQGEEQDNEAHEPTEVEKLAAGMGWAPEDDWRGDPEKWVDAPTFIRTGPEILKKTLERQDGQLAETRKLLDDFKGFHNKVEERAYNRAMTDLKAEQRQAVEDGDTAAFDGAQAKIDELGEEAKPADTETRTDQQTADNDPAFIAFKAANPWYGTDVEMTLYAEKDAAPIIGRTHQGQQLYDAIGVEIRRKFPDKFTNTRRRRPASVEAAGSGGERRGNGQGYADLPADAKTACDRYIKEGMFAGPDKKPLPVDQARAKYVEQYDWSE